MEGGTGREDGRRDGEGGGIMFPCEFRCQSCLNAHAQHHVCVCVCVRARACVCVHTCRYFMGICKKHLNLSVPH
jgi:hypothetical protein